MGQGPAAGGLAFKVLRYRFSPDCATANAPCWAWRSLLMTRSVEIRLYVMARPTAMTARTIMVRGRVAPRLDEPNEIDDIEPLCRGSVMACSMGCRSRIYCART